MAEATVMSRISRFCMGHLVLHRCVPGAARWDARMEGALAVSVTEKRDDRGACSRRWRRRRSCRVLQLPNFIVSVQRPFRQAAISCAINWRVRGATQSLALRRSAPRCTSHVHVTNTVAYNETQRQQRRRRRSSTARHHPPRCGLRVPGELEGTPRPSLRRRRDAQSGTARWGRRGRDR